LKYGNIIIIIWLPIYYNKFGEKKNKKKFQGPQFTKYNVLVITQMSSKYLSVLGKQNILLKY